MNTKSNDNNLGGTVTMTPSLKMYQLLCVHFRQALPVHAPLHPDDFNWYISVSNAKDTKVAP